MVEDGVEIEPAGSRPLPALLRGARAALGSVIRHNLAEAGYEDVPPNGLYVLGGMAGTDSPLGDIIWSLGVSKQTAGTLVDSLVVRGYLDRRVDPEDRRRMVVSLTDHGSNAAAVIRDTVAHIESSLEAAVGADAVAHTRRSLAALAAMGHEDG